VFFRYHCRLLRDHCYPSVIRPPDIWESIALVLRGRGFDRLTTAVVGTTGYNGSFCNANRTNILHRCHLDEAGNPRRPPTLLSTVSLPHIRGDPVFLSPDIILHNFSLSYDINVACARCHLGGLHLRLHFLARGLRD
jgi:hypothetical protein